MVGGRGRAEGGVVHPHLGQICEKLQLCTRPLQLELAAPSALPALFPAMSSSCRGPLPLCAHLPYTPLPPRTMHLAVLFQRRRIV